MTHRRGSLQLAQRHATSIGIVVLAFAGTGSSLSTGIRGNALAVVAHGPVSGPVAPQCSIGNGAGHCPGALPTKVDYDDLKMSLQALSRGGSAGRPTSIAVTAVNDQSRHFDTKEFAKLGTSGYPDSLLVGAINYSKDANTGPANTDPYYKINHSCSNSDDDDYCRIYVIAGPPPAGTPARPYGMIVGGWKMYYVRRTLLGYGKKKLYPVMNQSNQPVQGIIIECTNGSDANTDTGHPYSYFSSCLLHSATRDLGESQQVLLSQIDSLANIAASNGMRFKQYLDTLAARAVAPARPVNSAAQKARPRQRASATPVARSTTLPPLIAVLLKYTIDPMQDPYWFSCGVGCCTAEI